jgi:hypothetical protein
LTNLTANMLGEKGERKLKAKAVGLLLFFLDMVRKYAAQIGAPAAVVLECGECVERYARLCKREGVNVSVATQQERVRGQCRYSLSTLASTRLATPWCRAHRTKRKRATRQEMVAIWSRHMVLAATLDI